MSRACMQAWRVQQVPAAGHMAESIADAGSLAAGCCTTCLGFKSPQQYLVAHACTVHGKGSAPSTSSYHSNAGPLSAET
jgi:hypothetical protein